MDPRLSAPFTPRPDTGGKNADYIRAQVSGQRARIINDPITGYHKARMEACPSWFFLACTILVLCMMLLGGVVLAKTGQARHAAWHYAEARV